MHNVSCFCITNKHLMKRVFSRARSQEDWVMNIRQGFHFHLESHAACRRLLVLKDLILNGLFQQSWVTQIM